MPFCTGVTCEKLPHVGLNMKLQMDSQYYNSQLFYQCEQGYKLNTDNITMTCDLDGKWVSNELIPACDGNLFLSLSYGLIGGFVKYMCFRYADKYLRQFKNL